MQNLRDVTRTARNDAEAGKARDRMMRLRNIGRGLAPSAGVTKGRNKPRRMGKTQGYAYGGKACRGRKANYKA